MRTRNNYILFVIYYLVLLASNQLFGQNNSYTLFVTTEKGDTVTSGKIHFYSDLLKLDSSIQFFNGKATFELTEGKIVEVVSDDWRYQSFPLRMYGASTALNIHLPMHQPLVYNYYAKQNNSSDRLIVDSTALKALWEPYQAYYREQMSNYQPTIENQDPKVAPNHKNDSDSAQYDLPEYPAAFPGKREEMIQFIQKNLNLPIPLTALATQQRMMVRFIVTETGEIQLVEFPRSNLKMGEDAVIELLLKMPRWIPAYGNNRFLPSSMNLPLNLNF